MYFNFVYLKLLCFEIKRIKKMKKDKSILPNLCKPLLEQSEIEMDQGDLLFQANEKLAIQSHEKEKRAQELLIANKELHFQNCEKENRAKELVIANKELVFQNSEKENRAKELLIANKELVFQNSEKEKRAAELKKVNKSLKKIKKHQTKYIVGLEEIMFMTSHAVRLPVTNILGLATQLESCLLPDDCHELIEAMKTSAVSLDVFTRELTQKITILQKKNK